jgi:membrane protein DedA with SNARE-associated domain
MSIMALMFEVAITDSVVELAMLAAVTLLHELGAPVPMSPAALLAGARAAAGAVTPLLPVAAIVVASMLGNAVWFAAGRRYGVGSLQRLHRWSSALDAGARHGVVQFDRWGAWALVIGRFIPGASLVAPPLAGATGMGWTRFLLLTAAGSLLHGFAIVGAGMLLQHEVEAAVALLEDIGAYAGAAAALAIALYGLWRWRDPIARVLRVARTPTNQSAAT